MKAREFVLALIWIAGLAYLGLVAMLTWQALHGQSIVAPVDRSLPDEWERLAIDRGTL